MSCGVRLTGRCEIWPWTTARLDIQYPMLFSLSNAGKGRKTHAGVLEFLAEPGRVYLPHWVRTHSLPPGTQLEACICVLETCKPVCP